MNVEYEVVVDRSVESLSVRVQEKLSQGWMLAGGLAIGRDFYNRDEFYQAIYRACP